MKNYNLNPIIIQDNNTIFTAILGHACLIFCNIYAIFFATHKINWTGLSIASFFVWYRQIKPHIDSEGKRKIELNDDKIKFMQENFVIEEINLQEKFEIYKTFENFYHKSQKIHAIFELFYFRIIAIISSTIGLMLILIIKFCYNLFKNGLKDYRFFDSIIILQDDKLINILPNSNTEYKMVREYFLDKFNIDIKSVKIFRNFTGHVFEKIKIPKDN